MALISSTPVSRSLNLGTTTVTAAAQTTYLGAPNTNIKGYSIGSGSPFAAYHFLIQGNGTVNGVNLPAVTAQGVFRIAPATNN